MSALAVGSLPHASSFKPLRRQRKPVCNAARAGLEIEEYHDEHFRAALLRVSLRLQETLRPDPLFIDPYIGCLLPPDHLQMDKSLGVHSHCLATKFIDDKLLGTMEKNDGPMQVVLFTDGMDTRPYRLNWPASTILFDVSPDRLFRESIQKLEAFGAKVPRSCLFLHIPSEAPDVQQELRSKGFSGTRPSLWVLQGLPIMTLANFKDTLSIVSNLTMKGCFFMGEVPGWLVGSETMEKSSTMKWMDKIFMSHGLRVEMIKHDEVARRLGEEVRVDEKKDILFMAEQLQFSDDQMEMWRRELQRMEDEADEEGFEEL
ncbi:O-methyltransferase 1, chloroplastic [Andrographis paniculata]|uniref:O-methyltransferase 1, chloroplastic n=1 Tax=Andrographis paniculata TaxID=175694 RepID=UPI0021E7E4FF|nr:O-methyltransferase 1, chloroplastic [Andrographis paniculata]